MFFFKKYFFLSYTLLLFLIISCHSNKEENTLYLENNLNTQSSFPYKPQKIKIEYHKDTIFIYKIFNSQQTTKYTLFLKNNQYYFLDNLEKSDQRYIKHSYLLLKNKGGDSCYSITMPYTYTYSNFKDLLGFDLCFSKLKNNNFTTIIRFNSKDTLAYNENYYYTKNYRIYKVAFKYNGSLYWYQLKK